MAGAESLPVIKRAITLIEYAAKEKDGMSFGEIKEVLPDVAPSSLSRLLKVLLAENILYKADGSRRYMIGERIKTVSKFLTGNLTVQEIVQPILDRLAESTGESSALFVFNGRQVTMTAKRALPQSVHYMEIGNGVSNFSRHGFAKVAAAFLPEDKARKLLEKYDPPEEGIDTCMQHLKQIREQKFLVNVRDDMKHFKRVTAPVIIEDKNFLGVIGITFFAETFPEDRRDELVQQVVKASREASAELEKYG